MYDGVSNQDWVTFGVNLHQQILCYNLVNSQKVVVGIEPTAVAQGFSSATAPRSILSNLQVHGTELLPRFAPGRDFLKRILLLDGVDIQTTD